MDVGRSLNPVIDIGTGSSDFTNYKFCGGSRSEPLKGQIEGAFMQGVGLFTMEDQLYSKGFKIFTIPFSILRLLVDREKQEPRRRLS